MNSLRLSTFSLTIVLFTMGALILPVNTALADHCKGKHKNGPGCDDPGGDTSAIEYTAQLTGAFAFNSVDVTANKQGNVLKSADPVTLTKPTNTLAEPMLEALWNSVFQKCPNFFEPTEVIVPGFTALAGKKGWTIEKPGGVRVNFRLRFPRDNPDVVLNMESAWVALSLIGDEDFQDPFPPVGEIRLSHFTIHGQTESGVTPRLACDDESFTKEDFFIMPTPIYLTITGPN
jgi:hypothetical protein